MLPETLDAPVSNARRIRQFVRIEKHALLERLSAGSPAKQAQIDAISELLGDLARLAGCDLRDDHVQWFGDVLLVDQATPPVWWTAWRPSEDVGWCGVDVHVRPELRDRVRAQVRITGVDDMYEQRIELAPTVVRLEAPLRLAFQTLSTELNGHFLGALRRATEGAYSTQVPSIELARAEVEVVCEALAVQHEVRVRFAFRWG